MKPTGPKDFFCHPCADIQRVMRAVEIGARTVGADVKLFPSGNNACRIECDTSTAEFRRFAALMRKGIDYLGAGTLYSFSVRSKTETGAIVRHMAG
jgi:hypothetical protein